MSGAFRESDYERAIRYPWERPERSFVLRGEALQTLDTALELPPLAGGRRTALITFGSNGSPKVLRRKLAGLSGADAEVAVVTGRLDGYSVAPSAHLALYGALPATIVRAPGANVRAGLMLVTDAQLGAIGLTEFNYHVVRLSERDFAPDLDLPGGQRSAPLAYVSRHGVFEPHGVSVAGSSQAEILEAAAEIVLGEHGTGRELVRRTIEDYRWAVSVAEPLLAEHARPHDRSGWEIVRIAAAERQRSAGGET